MQWALTASLVLNGAFAGFIYGVFKATEARVEEAAAGDVPGGGILIPEDEGEYAEAEPTVCRTVGFKN